jgi:hypothetical protein
VTYYADRAPEEFKNWARAQNEAGVVITAPLAEDAMRGPEDSRGQRHGGLLQPGVGLSRETIRKWVSDLPKPWIAKQGVPPSRMKTP